MTNREMFMAIVNGQVNAEVVAKAQEELDKLDARNAKRREKPSKKAQENAVYVKAIAEVLTKEPQTASEIAEKVEISTSKASALLSRMDGVAVTELKIKGKGKRNGYALA